MNRERKEKEERRKTICKDEKNEYKTAVRPWMLSGLDTVEVRKRQEAGMWMYSSRKESITGPARVRCFGNKVREAPAD